ncbi:hypothetical protein EYV94_18890 [Puteibacter caeruleilacunae]|nr:hypothetical protein EYV94_18890 [Puteibacter caeruleilacunae]
MRKLGSFAVLVLALTATIMLSGFTSKDDDPVKKKVKIIKITEKDGEVTVDTLMSSDEDVHNHKKHMIMIQSELDSALKDMKIKHKIMKLDLDSLSDSFTFDEDFHIDMEWVENLPEEIAKSMKNIQMDIDCMTDDDGNIIIKKHLKDGKHHPKVIIKEHFRHDSCGKHSNKFDLDEDDTSIISYDRKRIGKNKEKIVIIRKVDSDKIDEVEFVREEK